MSMPLHLTCSNRVEALQGQLASLISAQPLTDPFQPELILVPNLAMKRWLNLQLAASHGIAANIEYSLPAAWVWRLAAGLTASGAAPEFETDPLSRDQAAWLIYGRLPGLLTQEAFRSLRDYLQDDSSGIKRWQLAQRIADIFDRYQYYRPEWIRLWSSPDQNLGREFADVPEWQPLLWQQLLQHCAGRHRVALIDQVIQHLSKQTQAVAGLPERMSCFALSSLPPLFVQVFKAIAQHVDVHLYQHSPSNQYWADLRSKKSIARMRIATPDEASYYDTGNELLASWGRQGQALQDLLLESDAVELVQREEYPAPGNDTLLHRLQQDILDLRDACVEVPVDDSVEIGICHSPLRECQVLHDTLLRKMDMDSALKPEDILVIVPEISRYAPYIESVFRRDENNARPFIPWNLSDVSVADEHPLIRVFLQLLALPTSRFTFSEVISFVDVALIAQNFNIEPQRLEELLALLRKSEVRWGLNAEHKLELGLPATEQNTWRFAADRVLAGYAFGDAGAWQGIAPVADVSGARAAAFGHFFQMLDVLSHWHKALHKNRTALAWQADLNRMLKDVFGDNRDEDDKLQEIRDAIAELVEHADQQDMTLELLRLWLTQRLSNKTVNNRFFSGGVTICGMRPMRSLPFKLICVLGMNDLAFPRRDDTLAFDGMAKYWRPGDPRKADEDRYLLLETLLCAREKIYFSYTGRSLKDNLACQPSVLLQELLDVIDSRYIPVVEAAKPMSHYITHVYPLQAFSRRNFFITTPSNEKSVPGSYDRWWCQVACSLQTAQSAPLPANDSPGLNVWPDIRLSSPDESVETIDLARLIRFLQHPIKYFFNTRLRLYVHSEDESEDEEVFSFDGLRAWQIRDELIAAMFAAEADGDTSLDALQNVLSAKGLLPHGAMAKESYAAVRRDARALLSQLQVYRGRQTQAMLIDIPQLQIAGQIQSWLPGTGLLHYSPSSMKSKLILKAWVEHLALCAQNRFSDGERTILYCRDSTVEFPPVDAERAMTQLDEYCALYREGLTRPLPIFPETSFELAWGKSWSAAKGKWNGSDFLSDSTGYARKGEKDEPYIKLALRACQGDPLGATDEQSAFRHLAAVLYDLAKVSGVKA
jgi:exodeoxyribonuclease V gamma subunit